MAGQVSAGFAATAYTENWRVYADWNCEGDLADAGETLVSRSSNSAGSLSTNFTVPAGLAAGGVRRAAALASQDACSDFASGEVEVLRA